MIMVVVIFGVCWLPYHIYFIVSNTNPEINFSPYIQVRHLSNLLPFLNALLNFIFPKDILLEVVMAITLLYRKYTWLSTGWQCPMPCTTP